MITLINLSKSYGEKTVLDKINLQFVRGKVYGIVGENGAGKTTLFSCLSGIESSSGKIETEYELLKNHLGFLPTNPHFMNRITGWEYLKLLCVARNIKEDDFESKNIFELPLDQYAETYSTGMKKKLAFMGILLQKNDIYILDEPFNGVDIHSNIIITEIIQKLKSRGKIVLISSHIFSTLSDNCDEIHMLKDGHVFKSVEKSGFESLNEEMKGFIMGDRVSNFEF